MISTLLSITKPVAAAARAIADRKELDRKLDGVARERDEWDEKAELAVRKGRDDLARAALAERARVEERVESLETILMENQGKETSS